MDFKVIWPKVLKLQAAMQLDGANLSRPKIKKHFDLTENNARIIYESLKNRKVIAGVKDISDDVAIRERLKISTAKLRESRVEIKNLMRKVELYTDLPQQRLDIPKALLPAVPKKGTGVVTVLNSDTHFDENVDPAEIGFVNGYDRDIADARVDKFFDSIIKLSRDYIAGVKIKALVFAMAGDMVSGVIHEELQATNCYPMADTLEHFIEKYAAGLLMLVEFFKELFVPCVPGNHGRFGAKVKFKHAVQDNFDYVFYTFLARELRREKHIKFYIPVAPDAYYPIFNTSFCLTHGNQFRGGQGWMGALGPVMRGDTKKKERQLSVKSPYDVMLCGHFHTQRNLGSCIMNGSLIGYNEYASAGNFSFEKPKQSFFLTDPDEGITISAPIHCKCDNEPWEVNTTVDVGF